MFTKTRFGMFKCFSEIKGLMKEAMNECDLKAAEQMKMRRELENLKLGASEGDEQKVKKGKKAKVCYSKSKCLHIKHKMFFSFYYIFYLPEVYI